MGKLYRGVSKLEDQKNKGKLLAKGDLEKVATRYGDCVSVYGKTTYGESRVNTVRAHQVESGMYNGRGISVTREQSVAESFATSGNLEEGYVYVLDEEYLDKRILEKFEFADAKYPQEHEVTLIAKNPGELLPGVVFGKYEVKPKN